MNVLSAFCYDINKDQVQCKVISGQQKFKILIIYMKKFLDCDWLREMQFLGNTVQKKGNLVQKRVTNVTF